MGLQNKSLGANGLKYCDAGVRSYLINERNWTISGDALGVQCIGNAISGNVRFDENANGCDATDIKINNLMVSANDGTYNYATFPDAQGQYNLAV